MSGEYREGGERDFELFPWITKGKIAMGIDPGSRNTGIVITKAEIPVFAETVVRNNDEDNIHYALRVAEKVSTLILSYSPEVVGLETVTMPKGFSRQKGKGASPINPGHLVMTGITLGTVAQLLKTLNVDVVYINPKGNGSRHLSYYPESLKNRRPKELDGQSHGAGRVHEQSAYDVAMKSAGLI